jgi:hypothetical protein
MPDSRAIAKLKVITARPQQAAHALDLSLRWKNDAGGYINTVDAEDTCEK